MESHPYLAGGVSSNGSGNDRVSDSIKAEKEEIAELEELEAQADLRRQIPLQSIRISDWKYICLTKCFDKLYKREQRRRYYYNRSVAKPSQASQPAAK